MIDTNEKELIRVSYNLLAWCIGKIPKDDYLNKEIREHTEKLAEYLNDEKSLP